jgi:hypothetical protein
MFEPAAKQAKESMMEFESPVRRHPPAFNVPRIIPWLIGLLAVIHLFRLYGPVSEETVIYYFAFIPARLGGTLPVGDSLLEQGARFWSLVTYSFLHADWMHWGFNSISMLAFGTPLARRLGAGRFLLLSALGSIGGALAYYMFHPSQIAVSVDRCLGSGIGAGSRCHSTDFRTARPRPNCRREANQAAAGADAQRDLHQPYAIDVHPGVARAQLRVRRHWARHAGRGGTHRLGGAYRRVYRRPVSARAAGTEA